MSRIVLRSSGATTFGAVGYPPGGTFGPRLQQDCQVVSVDRGEARVWIDDAPLRVAAGESALLRPGATERFAFARDSPTRHRWCAVSPQTPLGAEGPSVVPTSPALDALLRLGLESDPPTTSAARAALDALGLAVLAAHRAAGEARAAPHPDPVARALRAIEADLGARLTVESLAEAACVTPSHLIRRFRESMGTTPAAYLWDRRTEAAIGMLRETGLTLDEIAWRTGFASPFHLSRRVRERTGLSPRALRKSLWECSPSSDDA